jgi:iron complex outermembrane receptor protein
MNGTSPLSGRARALVFLFAVVVAPPALGQAEPKAEAQLEPAATSAQPAAVEPAAATTTEAAIATPTSTATPTPTPTATQADIEAAEDLPAIDEIVVVGRRRRGEAERDPTASATVIDAATFVGEAKGVAELVSTAPGVAVNDYGGLGHLTTVSLRGAAADGVLVLLDGIPLQTAFGGGVDLASIPRHWIERIEIIRGVEGAHYGAGALGGVLNVVTRSRRSGWSGEATAGSFDTIGLSAEGAFSAGDWTGLVAAGGEETGGSFHYDFDPSPTTGSSAVRDEIRRNDAVRRGGLLLKLSSAFGATVVETVAQLSARRRELPGSPYRTTPRDWEEDGRALVAVRVSTPGPWRGVLLAGRASLRGDRVSTRIDPALIAQRGTAAGLTGEARVLHPGGQLRLTLEAQGESVRGDGLPDARSRSTLAAAVSEDVFLGRGRVRVSPAVRAERIGEFSGVSAKLGGSLRLLGPLALRASGGQTFRAPSFAELYVTQGVVQPNPDLRSEKGLGGDAALVVDIPAVHASVGGYATLYRDLIWYQQASLGRLKPFNSGKALVRGVEAEVATAPVRAALGLSIAGAYTFLDSENLRGVEGTLGNELPRRARHRMFARASIAPGSFSAHVEAHRVGRQFTDLSNSWSVPAVTTCNVGGALWLSPRGNVALHAEVRNVFDDRTLVDPLASPLPGRMVLVTLRGGSHGAEVMP